MSKHHKGRVLTGDEKRRNFADAQYMGARMRGERATPPAWWSPEQIALWERVIASPEGRAHVLAETMKAQVRLYTEPGLLEEMHKRATDFYASKRREATDD